jgi:hypothetical protein
MPVCYGLVIACLLCGCANERTRVATADGTPAGRSHIARTRLADRANRNLADEEPASNETDVEADDESLVMPVAAESEPDSEIGRHSGTPIVNAWQVPPSPASDEPGQMIDLSTALQLTAGNSPQVAFAMAH